MSALEAPNRKVSVVAMNLPLQRVQYQQLARAALRTVSEETAGEVAKVFVMKGDEFFAWAQKYREVIAKEEELHKQMAELVAQGFVTPEDELVQKLLAEERGNAAQELGIVKGIQDHLIDGLPQQAEEVQEALWESSRAVFDKFKAAHPDHFKPGNNPTYLFSRAFQQYKASPRKPTEEEQV